MEKKNMKSRSIYKFTLFNVSDTIRVKLPEIDQN